jgi:acyl carrier protein
MRPDRRGENRLIGYVTPGGERAPGPDALRRFLAGSLPEYMVPTAWVTLEKFPLSFGWKIDTKALPDPVEDTGRPRAAARTSTEAKICEIFTDVLAGPQVGAEDGFFQIGGNSLQAMRAVNRINKTFGVNARIRLLYGSATVRDVAAAIDQMTSQPATEA